MTQDRAPSTTNDATSIAELSPVEYIVIHFPGNRFTGAIAPAVARLVDDRVVRILDLLFIEKDTDGVVTSFEFDQLDELGDFAAIDGDAGDLLSVDDVDELAHSIPANSSALCIVWEDLWAAELGRAIRDAGGEVIVGGRVPHDVLAQIASESQEVPS